MTQEVSDSFFVEESVRVVNEAEKRGIILRILGALAIHIHCPEYEQIHYGLDRLGTGNSTFTDIDYVAYKKQSGKIRDLFEKEIGYLADPYVLYLFGGKRLIYNHPKGLYYIDVFFDELDYSHVVKFGKPDSGRLELDSPTITLADLVLEKTQIHEINEKDIKDLLVLFLEHNIEDKESREAVNGSYIAQVLADDWGFWYDATNNLEKVKSFTDQYLAQGKLTDDHMEKVKGRIDELLQMIQDEPKTKSWNKRAKKGVSKQWWQDVEEVYR